MSKNLANWLANFCPFFFTYGSFHVKSNKVADSLFQFCSNLIYTMNGSQNQFLFSSYVSMCSVFAYCRCFIFFQPLMLFYVCSLINTSYGKPCLYIYVLKSIAPSIIKLCRMEEHFLYAILFLEGFTFPIGDWDWEHSKPTFLHQYDINHYFYCKYRMFYYVCDNIWGLYYLWTWRYYE